MFSVGEDWISCYKINESENDFMQNLNHCGILFWCCKIQWTNENIWTFWPQLFSWKNFHQMTFF
jgi:hypothetical protein